MTHLADVLVPPNAEGTRATVLRWCKQLGDAVVKDEPLVELETDKVTVEIPSPATGILIEVLKEVNAEVIPDEVLARLSLGGESTAAPTSAVSPSAVSPSAVSPAAVSPETKAIGGPTMDAPMDAPLDAPAEASDARDSPQPLSPAVRRLLAEHSLAAADVDGTGRDGRITAQDVIRHAAAGTARAPAR